MLWLLLKEFNSIATSLAPQYLIGSSELYSKIKTIRDYHGREVYHVFLQNRLILQITFLLVMPGRHLWIIHKHQFHILQICFFQFFKIRKPVIFFPKRICNNVSSCNGCSTYKLDNLDQESIPYLLHLHTSCNMHNTFLASNEGQYF